MGILDILSFGKKKTLLTAKDAEALRQASALLDKVQAEIKGNKISAAKKSADTAQKMISRIEGGRISAIIAQSIIYKLNSDDKTSAFAGANVAKIEIAKALK